ncbi:sensor histidine kinase [Mucilaginibacter lacusdianchii]|uniref:sensor histidine kinase n=1 Tax=Mucilaginibacter lacusdianchii TaxID=2684211 RepID=UPI0018EEF8CD|nr:histidine kinase [Mucilaginibacter sp. JXJ CY 39]
MKLKYLEIAIATLFLLTNTYGLLGTADLYWRGNFSADSFGAPEFKAHGLQFNFTTHYLMPNLILYFTYYLSFIWMACALPNRYFAEKKWNKAIAATAFAFLITLGLFTLKRYLSSPYGEAALWQSLNGALNQALILYTALLFYQAARQSVLWLSRHGLKNDSKKPVLAESAYFIITWFVVLSGCILLKAYWGVTMFVGFILPCTFGVYLLNVYWLFPAYFNKTNRLPFWAMQIAATLCLNVPFNGFYSSQATYSGTSFMLLFVLLWGLQLCLIIPIAYYVYKHRQGLELELTGLKNHLDTTDASLQLLKSQINPHFLFNALNTLYGMALTEKAENTGDGIQRLGDMMRFMLHENMQDKIELSKEINYLNNYLSLQNMRIASNPVVDITVHIQESKAYHLISPMLLIPFVENAYKHGISLKERSWIHINLYFTESNLHLDVHNSIHLSKDDDFEKGRSGIGLKNVKQRLALLYPQKHELVIHQNTKEFFIHLNIQLQ